MKSVVFLLLIAVCGLFVPGKIWAQGLTDEQRVQLQQELAQVEAEQKQAALELSNAQNKSASLAKDIAVLDAKIRTAQLNIKAKNILIQSLGNDITKKVTKINDLEDRIDKGKDTLAQILRKTNEVGEVTLPELILSRNNLTELITDLDTFASVQESLRETFDQLKSDKDVTTAEKSALDNRRNAEMDARYEIQQQQKDIEGNQAEKKQLLSLSKGAEKSYTKLIADKQARAAQIKSALFKLAGAVEIPFGDAYNYALEAQKRTGIRPAFLLAIFAQESSLDKDATFGKNVGSCFLVDKITGSGIRVSTKTPINNVMKPNRDVEPFLRITKELGADPYSTLVSCPLSSGGYGGAMGPAQFLPSTWVDGVADRVARLLGISGMPNPWNPEHAFLASAMYLTDLGASKKTYTSERTAALKYYAGGNWNLAKNAFYGNQVMIKAESIQRTMIDLL